MLMNATALILVDPQAAAVGGFGIPALPVVPVTMTPDAIARERDASRSTTSSFASIASMRDDGGLAPESGGHTVTGR